MLPAAGILMIFLVPRLKGGERPLEVMRLICLLNRDRFTVYLSISMTALACMVLYDDSLPGEMPRAILIFAFISGMIWFIRWFAKKGPIR